MDILLFNGVVYLTTPEFTDYARANIWEVIVFFVTLTIGIVFLMIAMQEMKRQALMKIINEDKLTGLKSEYAFIQEVNKKRRENVEYSLISIDIDNFKYINEVYGYEKGTEVLKSLSKSLKRQYCDCAVICREKQDEFLVFIERYKCKHFDGIDDTFEEDVKRLLSEDYHVHISIGTYHMQDEKQDMHYMIDCAKQARNSKKEQYGHTSVEFTENMRNAVKVQNRIIASMEKGIDESEFSVVYQAKVDVKTEEIVGAEALVRWNYKNERVAHPDDFIRVFERNGFIKRLDLYVLEEVCKFIYKNEYNIPKISVNFSGITFISDTIMEDMMRILEKYGIKPKQIELEITESAIVKKVERVSKRIEELTKMGFYVSMDDFGSGISSINRLKDINIDELKIDKSFLRNIHGDKEEKGIKILGNVIKMATDLGLTTVVEGVESKEQFELLKVLGCTKVQGFFFSKPLNELEFLNKVRNK